MYFKNIYEGYNAKEDFRIMIFAFSIEEAKALADEFLAGEEYLEGEFSVYQADVTGKHYDYEYLISRKFLDGKKAAESGNPVVNELQIAINNATDAELVEAGIGCVNLSKDREYAFCKYMEDMRCIKGAFLTSTSIGAHPADCPMYKDLK